MARHISDKSKQLRGMGTGEGSEYIPYITTSEFNSSGTTSVITDWKTGRQVHCLSQSESLWYYILRWRDDIADIREQYPLDNIQTSKIAEQMGFKHPGKQDYVMTTDFLVTKTDGSYEAYSVKSDKNLSQRALQLLCIEKIYWNSNDVTFQMLFKNEVNMILANNIRLVTEFYDESKVFDKYSKVRHMIATKEIDVDLTEKILDNTDIDRMLEGERYENR